MWASEIPPPTGGMPCRSTKVKKASGSRAMISNERSVPRVSCHMSMGISGRARVSIGTIEEYWLQTPTAVTSAATSGRVVVTSRTASRRVVQVASASCSATAPVRSMTRGRWAAVTVVPSLVTSATLTFVVPTSTPRPLAMPQSCRTG